MKIINLEYDENTDFVDKMIQTIEKEYGCPIARIPHFEKVENSNSFDLKIIFTDFKYLEGQVHIIPYDHSTSIEIQGTFY